jgi:exodeoxyribonuclease III
MKLATWNVNSLTARMPRVLEFLGVHAPDVFFMQETKCEPDAFPMLELEAAGYRTVHHSAGRWAGVAMLARAELDDICAGLAGEPSSDEARWLEASVDGLRAVSVYVPNGRSPDSPFYTDKLRFLDAMARRIRELSGDALVVAGDFNVCPSDLDVYDPGAFVGATHVTPPERERFRALLDAGTVDAFRELHPDKPGFTWWDHRLGHFHRKMGLRIDAFLLSPPLAGELAKCGIDRSFRKGSRASDHAPLICELRR